MKKLISTFAIAAVFATVALASPPVAEAGTGATQITHIAVTTSGIHIYTSVSNNRCGNFNRWILKNSHPYFDEMYKGILSAKLSGRKVDLRGYSTVQCVNTFERLSSAYVALP